MMNLLKKEELKPWLSQFDITEYKIINEGIKDDEYEVDFYESVNFSNHNIKAFPFRMNCVHGNFKAIDCDLTTLENSPKIVYGNFLVKNNKLTSLLGAPEEIHAIFNFNDNQVKNFNNAPKMARKIKCLNNPFKNFNNVTFQIEKNFEIDYQTLLLPDFTKLNLNGDLLITISVDEKEFQELRVLSNKKYYQTHDFVGKKTIIEDRFSSLKALMEKVSLENQIKDSQTFALSKVKI
jgi:hypothetical protein